MSKQWTEKHAQELKAAGKIRDYQVVGKGKKPAGRIVGQHFKKKSKEKDHIARVLLTWCQERSLQMQEEYRFTQKRKWRFDWAVPEIKLAVEYEGLMAKKSRHTTAKGYTGDTEKYNTAQSEGWRVLRYTALSYTNIENDLSKLIG